MMKKSKLKKNTGFTLIEIMVTVAIVGIFASIAIPSFSSLIENNRVNTATNELVSNLLLARSEALKRRNTVTICPSSDQTTCNANKDFSKGWVVFLDCSTIGQMDTGTITGCGPNDKEEVLKVGDGFTSLYLSNQNLNSVSFGFSGRLASATSRFEIGTDTTDRRKKVILTRVGRVRSCVISTPGC